VIPTSTTGSSPAGAGNLHPAAGHVGVLGLGHPGVAQVVSTDPGRRTFLVDQRGQRFAERMRRHVRHAEVLAYLAPPGAEVGKGSCDARHEKSRSRLGGGPEGVALGLIVGVCGAVGARRHSVSIAEVSVDSRIGSQVADVATADIRSGLRPWAGLDER
jgi:hypothetical protein